MVFFLDLWGPVNLGLSVDYFILSSFNLELGGGLNAFHSSTSNSINGLEFMGLGALRAGYHF